MRHVGVSSLRIFTNEKLRALTTPVIVHCHSQPIAVLVPYEQYLEAQRILEQFAPTPAKGTGR